MSAVPFYAVDTTTRALEYTKTSRLSPPSSNDGVERSSSFTALSSSCHQQQQPLDSTVKSKSSSFINNPISTNFSNPRKTFDSFTY